MRPADNDTIQLRPHTLMSSSKPVPSLLAQRLAGALCVFSLACLPASLSAQGCVIARGGGSCAITGSDSIHGPKTWQLDFSHRWFYSDRHFVGKEEQKHRKEQGTQVINNSHFLDMNISYAATDRLSANITVPFVNHDRSSLYEHLGNSSGQRFHTQAAGLGDIQASVNYWVLNPENNRRANFSIGAGMKAPTGEYNAQDIFIRSTGPTRRRVDSSIQPGDGGWGASLSLQGFTRLGEHWSAYGNGFYMFNPRERIAVTGFSVPDAYLLRVGVDYSAPWTKGVRLSLGLRKEGVPSKDVFGGSGGSRRPGYAVALEPGFSYMTQRVSINVTVPVAIERNRVRTFGASNIGDAAFADYTVNSNISIRL